MVLVAVNPYQHYPIYGEQHINDYKQVTDTTDKPPHIYATAQHAFISMKRRLQNQSIIIRWVIGSMSTSKAPSNFHISFPFNSSSLLYTFKLYPIVVSWGGWRTWSLPSPCSHSTTCFAIKYFFRRALFPFVTTDRPAKFWLNVHGQFVQR